MATRTTLRTARTYVNPLGPLGRGVCKVLIGGRTHPFMKGQGASLPGAQRSLTVAPYFANFVELTATKTLTIFTYFTNIIQIISE